MRLGREVTGVRATGGVRGRAELNRRGLDCEIQKDL